MRDTSTPDGGPLIRVTRRVGLAGGRFELIRLGFALALAAWVPLAALAAAGGVLTSGSAVPFLQSLGTHARLLVAIPLFFFAEAAFTMRGAQAINSLVHAGIVPPAQRPRFDAAVRSALAWRDSWALEAALVLLTAALVWQGIRSDLPGASSWRTTVGGQPSLASWWYTFFSLPLFQFLFWRWCARLLIWGGLLWRLTRLELQLIPTHPDRAGGLGALGVVHVSLLPFVFALSAMLVASFAEQLLYGGQQLTALVPRLAGLGVLLTVIVVAPLLVFTPLLVAAKQQGAIEYGDLASGYVRAFDAKWIRDAAPHGESLLGSADVQSLADLATSFGVIHDMRIVPIETMQLVLIAAAAAVPMAPLVLFVVPLDDLILRAVKTILHV